MKSLKLTQDFYLNDDVVSLAKTLIGHQINTNINGILTKALITETEAYAGISDKASHAYGGRRTKRTEVMYRTGGTVYVYLCYGMHYMFNIVTNKKDIPDAILIRAIYPLQGMDVMLKRVQKNKWLPNTGIGPGKVSKLLGINKEYDGISLRSNAVWLSSKEIELDKKDIKSSTRIGIAYAQEDALLPWRFYIEYQTIRRYINDISPLLKTSAFP